MNYGAITTQGGPAVNAPLLGGNAPSAFQAAGTYVTGATDGGGLVLTGTTLGISTGALPLQGVAKFSLNGDTPQTILMQRNTTANSAGNSLTLLAGGSTSEGTNLAGGDLILAAGTGTGLGARQACRRFASC